MFRFGVISSCLVLFSLISSSVATRCYNCLDGDVTSSFRKALKKDDISDLPIPEKVCGDSPPTVECSNSCYVFTAVLNGQSMVARGCSNADMDLACTTIQSAKSISLTADCALCREDECNSSTTVALSIITFVVSFFTRHLL